MKKILSIALLAVFLTALTSACRHSFGGGEPPQPETPIVASYTPAASPGNVRLTLDSQTGDTVTLKLEGAALPSFSGAAFKIAYDPAVLEYVGHEVGNLLETSATPVYASATVNGVEGEIAVGATLKRGDAMVLGDGVIIKLTFKAIAKDRPI